MLYKDYFTWQQNGLSNNIKIIIFLFEYKKSCPTAIQQAVPLKLLEPQYKTASVLIVLQELLLCTHPPILVCEYFRINNS